MINSSTKFATKNGCSKVAIKNYVETEVSTKLMKDTSTSFSEALIRCVESTHVPLTVSKKEINEIKYLCCLCECEDVKGFPLAVSGVQRCQ